jgi:hypothetical protein
VSVNAVPVPGKVPPLIKLPGSNNFVPLTDAMQLPPGTTVQLPPGSEIQLADPNGSPMNFFGQDDGVLTEFVYSGFQGGNIVLTLVGGNFKSYQRTVSIASHAAKTKPKPKKPVRRLWGKGKGHYTVKGKFASATVIGTWFLTEDYKDGTLIKVKKGVVNVRDFVNKKTKRVTAGHSVFVSKKKIVKTKTVKKKPKPKKKK